MLTYFHPEQLKHHPRSYLSRGKMRTPLEVPERATHLLEAVKTLGFEIREPVDHGLEPLAAVHSTSYLDFLKDAHSEWTNLPQDWGDEVMSNIYVREQNPLRGILGKTARYIADGSAPIGPHTYQAAYWSAQSAVSGAQAILDGQPEVYALCRPPGHHTRVEAAGGHCYLNNAAIAAQALRARYQRVAILDTDMHHGQGIQEIFYDRRDVLYVSVHGDPTNFYPAVAGFEEEHGVNQGDGYNINLPLKHGTSEEEFFSHLNTATESVQRFEPEALVLALGFDIYKEDPQSVVAVSTDGFRKLGRHVASLGLPTLIVQEGGYHLESLQQNTHAFFSGFQSGRIAARQR